MTEKQAWMILNGLTHVGPITLSRLMEAFGHNILKIFRASRRELLEVEGVGSTIAEAILNWRSDFDCDKEEERMLTLSIEFITKDEGDYSPLLKKIYDPPIGLYALGPYRPKLKSVAIVGSRRATLYGLSVAKRLGAELAKLGFCVVSGMARGIDSAAHEGALEAGGRTVAILGCGIDVIYPPENGDLYNRIKERGAVFSEFQIGRRADRRTFPMRNRIVSGMAQAVIVVETGSHGGSMITASMAGEQGRQVFAVPGRIDQNSSQGCHELLRNGASLLTKVDDILEELHYLRQMDLQLDLAQGKLSSPMPTGLDERELKIFECLRAGDILSSDTIASRSGLAVQDTTSSLLMLELKKIVFKRADGKFEVGSKVG